MMEGEELAAFITRDSLAWRIWMAGYETGLRHGHDDERAGMESLVELVARRQLALQDCERHIKKERINTVSMEAVRQARAATRPGNYRGGPVAWESGGEG